MTKRFYTKCLQLRPFTGGYVNSLICVQVNPPKDNKTPAVSCRRVSLRMSRYRVPPRRCPTSEPHFGDPPRCPTNDVITGYPLSNIFNFELRMECMGRALGSRHTTHLSKQASADMPARLVHCSGNRRYVTTKTHPKTWSF